MKISPANEGSCHPWQRDDASFCPGHGSLEEELSKLEMALDGIITQELIHNITHRDSGTCIFIIGASTRKITGLQANVVLQGRLRLGGGLGLLLEG